jgi:hypothetical protein
LSKTVATFIVQKILLDDTGLNYICATAERFFAVSNVLSNMIQGLTKVICVHVHMYVLTYVYVCECIYTCSVVSGVVYVCLLRGRGRVCVGEVVYLLWCVCVVRVCGVFFRVWCGIQGNYWY